MKGREEMTPTEWRANTSTRTQVGGRDGEPTSKAVDDRGSTRHGVIYDIVLQVLQGTQGTRKENGNGSETSGTRRPFYTEW